MTRTHTPIRTNSDGSRSLTVQRCCSNCGEELGDATAAELEAAMNGAPLPDVTAECACAGATA